MRRQIGRRSESPGAADGYQIYAPVLIEPLQLGEKGGDIRFFRKPPRERALTGAAEAKTKASKNLIC